MVTGDVVGTGKVRAETSEGTVMCITQRVKKGHVYNKHGDGSFLSFLYVEVGLIHELKYLRLDQIDGIPPSTVRDPY